MKLRYEWLFIGAVGVVALCILIVWRAPGGERELADGMMSPTATAPMLAAPPAAAVGADGDKARAEPAPAIELLPPLTVPPLDSDAERAVTREQRQAALPVFLAAADDSIATLAADIERARAGAADAGELAEMTARLETMQRVREQVLARNADIRH